MMTDLLNNFAPNGQYGYVIYWVGVASMILGSIFTIIFSLRICLRLLAIRVVQFEVARLHKLLVPSHFNDVDFDNWLFNPNALTLQSPIEAIMRGRGSYQFWFIEECTRGQTMVELYEGILKVVPANEPTKNDVPKPLPAAV